LKRTIGLKKDEYFVNHVHASKSEVQNILESAGLSKENPYNIVQQGKVDRLILMTDAQRLELLKEIAGTKTYDERRKESKKIMAETDSRREQINEVIEHLESRLADLEEEKEELAEFQKIDSERRSLEYAIYDKELKIATDKLDALDRSKEDSSQQTQRLHDQAAKLREERSSKEEEAKHLKEQAQRLQEKLELLKKDRQDYTKKKAVLDLKIKECKDKIEADKAKFTSATKELRGLTSKIEATNTNLKSVTKAYEKHFSAEEKLKNELQMEEMRLHSLHAKKGRAQQFSSKAERDRYLKSKVAECKSNLKTNAKQTKAVQNVIKNLDKKVAAMEKELKQKEKDLGKKKKRGKERIERY